jgi:hypothetical protein
MDASNIIYLVKCIPRLLFFSSKIGCYRDSGGGGDPNSARDGVEPPLGDEEPSLEGERERLFPLLSFIGVKYLSAKGRRLRPTNSRYDRFLLAASGWGTIYPISDKGLTTTG